MVVCAIGAKSGWSLFFFLFLTQSAETDTVQTIRAPAKAWTVAKLARQLTIGMVLRDLISGILIRTLIQRGVNSTWPARSPNSVLTIIWVLQLLTT